MSAVISVTAVSGNRTGVLWGGRSSVGRRAYTNGLVTTSAPVKRKLTARALLSDPWGTWAALSIAGAAGLAAEKTKLGVQYDCPVLSVYRSAFSLIILVLQELLQARNM